MKNLFRNVNTPILLILLLMLANRMLSSGQNMGDWIYNELLLLPGIVIGLTFHEAAHGFASHLLGDPTPKMQGRLSLNPARHIDPIGFIALLFCGFGWGEPVQINPMYYKHRRRDEMIVALAGITTNFAIALVGSLALKAFINSVGYYSMTGLNETIFYVLYYMVFINIVLMIFNLLPVPPLDGFNVLTQIFNLQKYEWYYTVYKNGFLILMVLILFNITDMFLTPGINFMFNLLF